MEKGPGSERRKEICNCGRRPSRSPETSTESCGPSLEAGPSSIDIQISLPVSAWHGSWWPVSTGLEEKGADLRSGAIQPDCQSTGSVCMSLAWKASCLEVGSIFFATVCIFIKTKITRRQCISSRDLERKRKGLQKSSYPFSSALVSMGTRAALCGLRKSRLPLPNAQGPIPRDCTCVANFSSVSLASPAPTGPQQQHPSPQKRKEKKSSVHLS